MKKAALLVMCVTILSKVIGLGREMVLSYAYGASAISDAYLISQTIPTVIFSFIAVGISTGFIPMYSRILREHGEVRANEFTNNLSNALLLVASIIVVIVLFATEPIVKLFASGFSGESLELAIRFSRISVFGVYFTALLNIFSGFLRVHGSHVIPSVTGVPMNLVIIGSVFISIRTSIYMLAIGSVLAIAAQFAFLIPHVQKREYEYQPILNLRDNYMKTMVMIAMPIIVGTTVNEINVLVDRTLASGIAVGGISALNYASRLKGFVQGLFVMPISTVMYPTISKMAAEENLNGLKDSVSEALSTISLLVIPATIGAMIFSREIVQLLFGRGAFTPDAIDMTANALFYYSIGMIAVALRNIASRVFYALQDTKTPMINATIAVGVNVVLNIVLSRYLGLGGLALATSISATMGTVLLFLSLRKKIGGFGLKEIVYSFVKIIIASIIMGITAFGSFTCLTKSLGENIALIGAIGIGALVYAATIYLMRVPEVERTINLIKGKKQGESVGERFLGKRR